MSNFARVVVADFEYEVHDGELPRVLCLVAYVLDENLQHIDTIWKWRGEFDTRPPFDVGPDTLFVAYSAWAEMTCFMMLGWKFPTHIFDLHTAYLAASNILRPQTDDLYKKPRKRLPDACKAYGLEGWERLEKTEIARDIGEGRWHVHGRERVFEYCEEDVRMSTSLLVEQLRGRFDARGCAILPPADVARVLYWSNYSAKVIAKIQATGMPIDVELWSRVQENKAAVIRSLVEQYDPSDGQIYTLTGEFAYNRFERWLSERQCPWSRLESGRLNIDGDAFRLMYHVPGIEGLHALRESLHVIVNAKLPMGADGRNRPSLFPFGTATGRNAHRKSLYNAHACMRSFMVFPPDTIGAYLDWRTQEVGIAAAQSGDPALIDAYRGGDVYHSLALACGFTTDRDAKHWKKYNDETRQRMKRLQLGINYGMGVPSLAKGLDRHPLIASGVIEMHKRAYPRYWEWREDTARNVLSGVGAEYGRRCIRSVFGWPLYLSTSRTFARSTISRCSLAARRCCG
jgi:DNA polymerase family A